jgi:hypothetical protein
VCLAVPIGQGPRATDRAGQDRTGQGRPGQGRPGSVTVGTSNQVQSSTSGTLMLSKPSTGLSKPIKLSESAPAGIEVFSGRGGVGVKSECERERETHTGWSIIRLALLSELALGPKPT